MTSDPSHQRNTLAEKRREWLACLSGEDEHSVYQQIHAMMWDAASFHVINQAFRFAPPAEGGGVFTVRMTLAPGSERDKPLQPRNLNWYHGRSVVRAQAI